MVDKEVLCLEVAFTRQREAMHTNNIMVPLLRVATVYKINTAATSLDLLPPVVLMAHVVTKCYIP